MYRDVALPLMMSNRVSPTPSSDNRRELPPIPYRTASSEVTVTLVTSMSSNLTGGGSSHSTGVSIVRHGRLCLRITVTGCRSCGTIRVAALWGHAIREPFGFAPGVFETLRHCAEKTKKTIHPCDNCCAREEVDILGGTPQHLACSIERGRHPEGGR